MILPHRIMHSTGQCGQSTTHPSQQFDLPWILIIRSVCCWQTEVVQFAVCVLELGESPSVTRQRGCVCASPHSSSAPFVIIKFSESRFCLSDTFRGSCEKTIFPARTSEEGKQQKQMCFIRGKTGSLDSLFKTSLFASGFHYRICDRGYQEGWESTK